MSASTLLAECPDCGSLYLWDTDAGVFRCTGCTAPDFHELAPSDIYVEHNERWHKVRDPKGSGGLVLAVTTFEPEPELFDDEDFETDPYAGYTDADLDALADDAADRHYDRD